MAASCGAHAGMSTRYVTSFIEVTPMTRPNSAIPIGSPIATKEPKAISRTIIATTIPATSPSPVGASSNAKNRSPPVSSVSDDSSRRSATASLRLSRSDVSRCSIAGYCTRTSAMSPSGETLLVVLSTCGSSPRADSTGRQLRRSVLGFEYDVGGDPALVGLGLGEQLRSLVGVEAGRLEALLELAPEGDGGGDDDEREDDPGADGDPGPGGGRPAEPVEEIGHASTLSRRRTIHIGPRTGRLLGRKYDERLVLVPRTTRPAAL